MVPLLRRARTVAVVALVEVVAAVVLAGVLPPEAGGPAPAAAAPPVTVVPCAQAAVRTAVSGPTELTPGCTYTAGFDITSSHTTLDCRGATIAGPAPGFGIGISSPTTVVLEDVHVVDCHVDGYMNGIHISRPGFLTLAEGVEYVNAFRDISIERSSVRNAHGVGIYVDGYVTGVTIRDSELADNGSTGIYLDTGSKDNVVDGNDIHGNGGLENGPGGALFKFGGLTVRHWGPGREGLAVDSSRDNRITGNHFHDNSAGSIFLYKNCGEYYKSQADSWLPRRYGANGNLIEGNTFERGLYGVWIASRMGDNTYPMECSSPAYLESRLHRYVLDEATDNVVRGNTFADITYGVGVEDDRNTVERNTFIGGGPDHWAVVAGTVQRTQVLHHPVTGTVVQANRSSIPGNPSPYRWYAGEADSTVTGNAALGSEVGWCEAPPVPHLPMVMVIAFAVELPGAPPTPTPDLTVKTLGAQPPCPAQTAGTSTTTTSTTAAPTTTTTTATTVAVAAPAAPVTATPTLAG